MVNVAINGFGRIGRMFFRASQQHDSINIVAVNDLTDTTTLAALLQRDSVHGPLPEDVEADGDTLRVGDQRIPVYHEEDPLDLPWHQEGVDVAVESTGLFRTKEEASAHLDAGADKVVISAPAKGSEPVKTIVMGVNEHTYDGERIVSNASCTTNSLAPLVKVLDDNFGVDHGLMTTVHSYTGSQNLIDGPGTKDLRRARSAAENIVPTTTGAAQAVTEVLPHLEGCLDGMAMRVPTPDGSITDLTCEVNEAVSAEIVNNLFRDVAKHHLDGVLGFSEAPLVSRDILGNPHSVIVDAENTKVMDEYTVKVLGWYDNEVGYSHRMADLIRYIT